MKRFLFVGGLLCSALCLNAQIETPTMGWSSWNTFSVNISEDIIKGQADAMVSQGLKDAGYLYINIDDGFQYGRLSNGKVRIHPQRFPHGLKVVSDYIHSKGLKAGIYSDAGDCTCGSLSNGDTQNTNVGFYGHEQTDADYYFKELEFDFIKVDYCGGNHAQLTEQEQYTAIHNAIVNTGKDVRYNLCRWAGYLVPRDLDFVANDWRHLRWLEFREGHSGRESLSIGLLLRRLLQRYGYVGGGPFDVGRGGQDALWYVVHHVEPLAHRLQYGDSQGKAVGSLEEPRTDCLEPRSAGLAGLCGAAYWRDLCSGEGHSGSARQHQGECVGQ